MKSIQLYTLVFLLAVTGWTRTPQSEAQQLLINSDFTLPLINDIPPGWFKASMDPNTAGLDMGLEHDEKGPYLYLRQQTIQKNILNNWAQRIESPPLGRKLRLDTEVATDNIEGQGGIVLLMFFDKSGRIVGGASSEDTIDLTGTREWTQVTMEADVPENADVGMVRIGLNNSAGLIKARYARLYLLEDQKALPTIETTPSQAGLELLHNGSFDEGMMLGMPVGWFKAMIPDKAINLQAGLETMAGRGQVAFIQQEGVKAPLINNWAQRLDTVPLGARLKLTAEVKTRDLPENTGFVMLQCWNRDDRLVGGATTQGNQPIGGTEDWKTVSLEIDVPVETESIIVRCGLAQSGRIWFDHVSLKVISAPASQPPGDPRSTHRGFQVTEASLAQIKRVQALADELARVSSERLGSESKVRREVYAQSDGTYEVVIYLDLGNER